MKKLLLPLLFAAMVVACSPEPQPSQTPQKPLTPVTPGGSGSGTDEGGGGTTTYEFTVTPSSLTFSAEGGSQTISLVTKASWKLSCQESWVSFGHSTGQGNEQITITVQAWEDTQYDRQATLLFEATGDNAKGSLSYKIVQTKASGTTPPSSLNVTVNAAAATAITSTSANVVCNYSDAPSTGAYDRGVYYGTSSSQLNLQATLNSSSATSGYFTVKLSSLEPGTTYYYKAYVTVYDESQGKYVDFFSNVLSFTTESGGQSATGLQYLSGYEIPAINLQNTSACNNYGQETYGSTNWYNYLTTNSNQMVITHTYSYNGKQYRNYTCLVDKTKKAPLWSAFVMHKEAYPDNNVGRTGSWTDDPGIPVSWQQSSSTSGYSRGHFVASNYRQATGDANKQTFYKTNQALQEQNGFNGSIWENLESAVVANAPSGRDTLYVVVGVLYEDDKTLGGVPCPSHFYKCLMKCSFDTSGNMTGAQGCAYLYTNVAHTGNYSQGLTSIDAVEQKSGWDFFTNVPKDLQDAAENKTNAIF